MMYCGNQHHRGRIMRRNLIGLTVAALFALFFAEHLTAQPARFEGEAKPAKQLKSAYSPFPDQKFPNRVLWGVAHVHTGYSFDAGMFGITLTPDDLFRVARGGEVVMDNGQRFREQAFAPARRRSVLAQQTDAHGTSAFSTLSTAESRSECPTAFRLTESLWRIKIAHDSLVRVR